MHKLDNPVWYSLSEFHQDFMIDYGDVKFYEPDHCPFGGIEGNTGRSKHLADYAARLDNFYILGQRPEVPAGLAITKEVRCRQMVLDKQFEVAQPDEIFPLTTEHADAIYELVNLVQPGYIRRKTASMGSYFGIFKNDELVAVTGERMKMYAYTEVSAVCTLPGHTGKGYASQLMAHTAGKIFSENKTPYLHVAVTNTNAIRLYEKLGFKTRTEISAWNIS